METLGITWWKEKALMSEILSLLIMSFYGDDFKNHPLLVT